MMLDTTYVVDLLRERNRGAHGPATAFLKEHAAVKLRLPIFALCELQLGVDRSRRPARERQRLQQLTEYLEPVYPEPGFARVYSQLASRLLNAGTPIPLMDLLIGTMAVQHAEPLVTGDLDHFGRIETLVLLPYRQ